MNDKDLKRRLEDELESIAPKMSQRVANAPIGTSSEGGAKRARAPRRKVRFTVAVSAIAAVLVIAIVLAVVVPPLFKTVPEQGEGGYLLMNINPDVEILFDEDGKVTSVKSGNADADVLLADESFRSSLVGESVDTAAAAVAERALEMGYIDGDATSPDAVGLTVVGGDGVAKIGAAVRAAFVDAGAACVVVAKTADRAWLAQRFDVAEGELKDMLAEVEKGADTFFERTAQDLADVSDLTREYVASVAEYLKDSLRTAAAEARAAQAMFAELETVNEEIESLADDMYMNWIGLVTASNIWDVDDYLAAHPDYLMSAELSAAVERAHALLKELAKYGCEPQSLPEAWVLGEAIGVFVDLCDEYGDDVLGMIDDAREGFSAVLTKVEELYQSAKDVVMGMLDGASDVLPGMLSEFEAALGDITDFAAAAIDSADDFIAESRRLADAAADKMASLGEAMSVSRDKLTAEQYADVERALIEEYGSLEAWWASLS